MKCNVADVLKKAKEKLAGLAVGTEERKQVEDVISTLAMIYSVKNGVDLATVTITPVRNTPTLDSLPAHSSTTKTMTYAGIGSRETPPDVLEAMTKVSKWLANKGYKLNTGKTFGGKEEGADKAFSDGTTNKELFGPERIVEGSREWEVAKELHPNWSALTAKGSGSAKLMARNTNQVFGANLDTPVDFVLFYAKETANSIRPKGGTGQAVEMARIKGIPTVNMADADWRTQLIAILEADKGKQLAQPIGDSATTPGTKNPTTATTTKSRFKIVVSDAPDGIFIAGPEITTYTLSSDYSDRSRAERVVGNTIRTLFKVINFEATDLEGVQEKIDFVKRHAKDDERLLNAVDVLASRIVAGTTVKSEIDHMKYAASSVLPKEQWVKKATELFDKYVLLEDSMEELANYISNNYGMLVTITRQPEKREVFISTHSIKSTENISLTDKGVDVLNNSATETKDEAVVEDGSNAPKAAGNAAKLNSDQQTAYNKISSMLSSKTQHTFLLEGAAGTGKSFTLGQIIADAADRKKTEILLGAVAHTAKDNLYFMAKEYVTETARLEAVVAVQMKQRLIEKANNALLSQVEANIVLVVDEVSMMLNKDIDDLTEIVNNINSTNPYVTVKMIMLGDRAQLRPIVVDVNYVNGASSVKVEGVSLSGSRKVVDSKDMFVFDMKENSTTDTALKLVRSIFGENADGTVSAEIRNDNGWLKLVIPNKNKLRGKVFSTINKDAAHMLTKQMRNITSTARLINMFREEAVESVWDAENSSKYKDKLFSALNAVKNDRETGNGNEFIGQGQKLSDTSIQDLLDGRASVLTAANKSATTINNTITKAVANKMGKIAEYEQYGMFVGQPLAMRVNTAEDVKNNAKVVVKELRLVGNSAYNIYDNHLAASFIGPMPEDAKVLAIMFTKTKVATVAADTGTVDILALGTEELENIVKTPQTFAEFASSNIKVIVQINKMPIPVPVDYNVALLAVKKLSVEERMSILTPAAPTYAFTIHKSQGMTMPRALVIDTMSFNPSLTAVQKLELLYVGLSRSSGNVAILQGRDVANSIADQVTTYLQKDESMLQGDRLSQNMVILDNSKAEEIEEALACKNKGK